MRTIEWDGEAVAIVDQTVLPQRVERLRLSSVDELCDALGRLAVRGAPALGAAGALGVALSARNAEQWGATGEAFHAAVSADARRIVEVRPTAVNLAWGVARVMQHVDGGAQSMLDAALALLEDEAECTRLISLRGADLLDELHHGRHRVLTHCNAGALACVEWGTALGVVRAAHERMRLEHVMCTETRPLLQGARLTAWELAQMGAPHTLIVDSAAALVMARGMVDVVVVGADRIAANGDVVNKIGTYAHALAAQRAGIPFVVAAPESTVDMATASGADVPIEERAHDEVVRWGGRSIAPEETPVFNPAFDVTPADLVTAIVTERRVIRPARGDRP
ncbi:MAG TPA: S-methyl-5-thioribose-1-phosphate isomerase [Candidatus Angelobacter sp.]|jgi:methylthioribose-1-phosphate isomerase|nr:S-methyl-5-thioribose-1-phosphate isomerase [Candidatus Angelobacter sp.]